MSVADVMVTKPGGLSISEALVKKLPMIFFSAIPGQETNNIKVLKTYEVSRGPKLFAPDRSKPFMNGIPILKDLDALRQRLSALSKPNAVADIIILAMIAQVVFDLPLDGPFDYLIPEHLVRKNSGRDACQSFFGAKAQIGFVMGLLAQSAIPQIKTHTVFVWTLPPYLISLDLLLPGIFLLITAAA